MSRSFKKHPWVCDRNPWMKNYANRRFRRYNGEVQNGKWYRKYTCPYDICDWKFLYSDKECDRWWAEPKYRYFMKQA